LACGVFFLIFVADEELREFSSLRMSVDEVSWACCCLLVLGLEPPCLPDAVRECV
jgi:hypothetical protein